MRKLLAILFLAAVLPAQTIYGDGWPGTDGEPIIRMGGTARIGQPFDVHVMAARDKSPCVLLVGKMGNYRMPWGLPLNVCPVVIGYAFAERRPWAPSDAMLTFHVPNLPALNWARVAFQWLVYDPKAVGNLAATKGLLVTVAP